MYIFSSGSCAFCSKQFVSYDIKTPSTFLAVRHAWTTRARALVVNNSPAVFISIRALKKVDPVFYYLY